MHHIKKKLRRKIDPASQDRWNVAEIANDLSTTSLHTPDGLGLEVWSEPSADQECFVDIIFLHGLIGKRTKTWLADGAERPWPQELLPKNIPEARIVAYGYDADIVNLARPAGQNTIREHGKNLIDDLTEFRRRTSSLSRPLIFVAHSLGGLVCEQSIVLSNESFEAEHQLIDSLFGILFLGTPHAGSDLSKFALALGNLIKFSSMKRPNTRLIAVLERNSEVLAGIQDSFSTAIAKREVQKKNRVRIHCCIEEYPVSGLGRCVVERASAHYPGYHTFTTIPADHRRMTKFHDSSQIGYKRVAGRLREWVDGIREKNDGKIEVTSNDILGSDVKISTGARAKILSTIPLRDTNFVGREDELIRLQQVFETADDLRWGSLYGLGGIGKSQIAIEYAHRLREASPNTATFWVHSSNKATVERSFQLIAEKVGIPYAQDGKANILELVSNWLCNEQNGPWLLILDNADDAGTFFNSKSNDEGQDMTSLRHYVPQVRHGVVLFTSRDRSCAMKLTSNSKMLINVQSMSQEDSVGLMRTKLQFSDDDEAHASELAEELEHIPLAITQACSYIQQLSPLMSIRTYLKEFRRSAKHQQFLLDYKTENMRREDDTRVSVITSWGLSFLQIKRDSPESADMLSLMSFFNRQAIPQFIIQNEEDYLLFLEKMRPLIGFSLVKAGVEEETFELHRLVQTATRHWLERDGSSQTWKEKAIELVAGCFPRGNDIYPNKATGDALLLHADELLQDEPLSQEAEINRLDLMVKTGWYLTERKGDHITAEKRAKISLNLLPNFYDPASDEILLASNTLGIAYLRQGRATEARDFQEQAYAIHLNEPDFSKEPAIVASHNLAMTYLELGYHDKAADLLVKVVVSKEQVFEVSGEISYVLSTILLADVRYEQQLYEEAKKWYAEGLQMIIDVMGGLHPYTLHPRLGITAVYKAQGDLEKESKALARIMLLLGEGLGPSHPNCLDVREYTTYPSSLREKLQAGETLCGQCVDLILDASTLGTIKFLRILGLVDKD